MEITACAHWRYKPKTQFCLSTPQRWKRSSWKSSAWPEFPKRSVLSDLKHSLPVEQSPKHKWGTSLALQVFDLTIRVCQFHDNPFSICWGISVSTKVMDRPSVEPWLENCVKQKSGCMVHRESSLGAHWDGSIPETHLLFSDHHCAKEPLNW